MTETDRAAVFGPMRLPFLLLPPACVSLGAATAVWSGSEINLQYLFIVFVGAVCAHISVNAFNEYDDFKSGLDFYTRRTPFSGGSGALPARPDKAHVALITGLVSLAVTTVKGAARHADDIPKLIPYMGRNVVINIITPVLLAIGLFIGP